MEAHNVLSVVLFLTLQSCSAEHFQVTTILQNPYMKVARNHIWGQELNVEGFIPDLMNALAERLGFTYSFQLVVDSRYGSIDSNGEWNGMIGEVLREEADIAAAALTITDTRQTAVDFTVPFWNFGIQGIKRRPTRKELVEDSAVETLEELAERDDVAIGFLDGGSTMNFFKNSHDPVVQVLWEKVENNPSWLCRRTEECLDKVKEIPNYVFFMDSSMVDYIVARRCELMKFDNILYNSVKGYGLAVRAGNPYLEKLNQGILELMADGVIQQIHNKWWEGVCN